MGLVGIGSFFISSWVIRVLAIMALKDRATDWLAAVLFLPMAAGVACAVLAYQILVRLDEKRTDVLLGRGGRNPSESN